MRPHHLSSGERQFAIDVIDTLRAVGLRNRAGDIAHDRVERVGRLVGPHGGFLQFALQAGEASLRGRRWLLRPQAVRTV